MDAHPARVARVHVVLVEPKYEGNVGAVARAMKNFGVTNLRLVNPCKIGEEARKRAMHSVSILEAAKRYRSYARAISGMDLVVGTSGVDTAIEKEKLNGALADLLAVTNYPLHKRGRTAVMFRRMTERAEPTTWEYHALMGVIARASKTVRRERAAAERPRAKGARNAGKGG